MLDDRHRRRVELGHAFERRIGVVQVVVGEFLALHLHRGRDAGPLAGDVERRRLVRVLAIAQRLTQRAGDREPSRKGLAAPLGEPGGDRRIVGSRPSVCLAGQTAAQRERGAAMPRHLIEHCRVLVRLGQHGDEIMVLRRGADQRRTADVDVLDALIVRGTLATVASNG